MLSSNGYEGEGKQGMEIGEQINHIKLLPRIRLSQKFEAKNS